MVSAPLRKFSFRHVGFWPFCGNSFWPLCMPDNGTGASAGWNWMLSLYVRHPFSGICWIIAGRSLFTAGTMTGFDASGHVAEETKNARWALRCMCERPHLTDISTIRVTAAKGILSSAIMTGIFGFAATILFLICIPDLNTLFSLNAPQPFVQVYAMALGKPGSIFMTIIAVLGLILVNLWNTVLESPLTIVLEHKCIYCRVLSSCFCCRARWCLSVIGMAKSSRRFPAAKACCYACFHIRCNSSLRHPAQPSGIHVLSVGWGNTYYRGLWPDRSLTLNDDA